MKTENFFICIISVYIGIGLLAPTYSACFGVDFIVTGIYLYLESWRKDDARS